MTIKDLLDACEGLKRFDIREVDEEHADIVIENETTDSWIVTFDKLLDPAVKKAGESANKDVKKIVKSFGGIQHEQTVYNKNFNTHYLLAMFWPWQNNRNTTIKVFYITNSAMDEMLKSGFMSNLFS